MVNWFLVLYNPPVRVAAILHPYENDRLLTPFRLPGANVFRGNSLEPGDLPDAAIVFGGDGSVHRVIQALAGSECPLLVVPTGSGNDFANAIGMRNYLVVHGVARITEGGAPELLHRLAQIYVGPGTVFPPMPDPPPGFISHITISRIGGSGPWIDGTD